MVQWGVKELTYITLQLREKMNSTNSFIGRRLKPFQNPTLSEYEQLVMTAYIENVNILFPLGNLANLDQVNLELCARAGGNTQIKSWMWLSRFYRMQVVR